MRRRRGRPLDRWLIIDKLPGLTSTDVVNRVRRGFDAQGGLAKDMRQGVEPMIPFQLRKALEHAMQVDALLTTLDVARKL